MSRGEVEKRLSCHRVLSLGKICFMALANLPERDRGTDSLVYSDMPAEGRGTRYVLTAPARSGLRRS